MIAFFIILGILSALIYFVCAWLFDGETALIITLIFEFVVSSSVALLLFKGLVINPVVSWFKIRKKNKLRETMSARDFLNPSETQREVGVLMRNAYNRALEIKSPSEVLSVLSGASFDFTHGKYIRVIIKTKPYEESEAMERYDKVIKTLSYYNINDSTIDECMMKSYTLLK